MEARVIYPPQFVDSNYFFNRQAIEPPTVLSHHIQRWPRGLSSVPTAYGLQQTKFKVHLFERLGFQKPRPRPKDVIVDEGNREQ